MEDSVDSALADEMIGFYSDPLSFVMFAYDWDSDPTLQIVPLPDKYRHRFANAVYGPDLWACELLDEIGEMVRARAFDGIRAVDAIREAVASGHGIGKSAMTAWLVDWIMSTRQHANGVVTANTSPQLESKTWSEIAKWTKKCITGH